MTENNSKATLLADARNCTDGMKLPRDLYSSKISYLIRCHRIASLICVFSLLFLIAVTWLFSVETDPDTIQIIAILLDIGVPFAVLVMIINISKSRRNLPVTAKVELLREIITQRPAVSLELWDVVAAHMNDYLCASGVTSFPLYYYDGNDCHDHFKSLFLDSNAPSLAELPSEISDNQHDSNIRNDPNRDIRPIVDEAVKVYDQSVKDYWRQQLREASSQLPEYPGQT
ncbi:LAFE_0H11298g1_1 [Lachancea fermentati]|uniref:LAFE_0H11298g1_1 n=1 Tax=Lachancea fermentati TaxID=4955 RepID=A0A1G4MKE7_LACFM|nr:LAFE_0H11298g1_1 [Lachancea fermentati]